MVKNHYRLTPAQMNCLSGKGAAPAESSYPARAEYSGKLPPVANQSGRGACVAHAVAALVASYEGCRRRISVQYLNEVTRLVEREWVTRNLATIGAGGVPEADFTATFAGPVAQAKLLVQANGANSEATIAFLASLKARLLTQLTDAAGCHLKHAFEALERCGACRDELWPYAHVALNATSANSEATGDFPPGTHEDARRHRIVDDLYSLRAPNNVDEIKGLLTGANRRRPMPVCAGLALFVGCTDETLAIPEFDDDGAVVPDFMGLHEVLIVGYEDDARFPGGGYFRFQNSWGTAWGTQGYGRVSYAYFACFCREAGTILQESDDYCPAGGVAPAAAEPIRRLVWPWVLALAVVAICGIGGGYRWRVSAPMPPPSSKPMPTSSKPMPPPSKPMPPPSHAIVEDDEGDSSMKTVKLIDYRFQVRGTCDTSAEARVIARRISGEHRTFTFLPITMSPKVKYFEGEVVIEGEAGWLPDPGCIIDAYLERKKFEFAVRKWDVKRLR